MVRKQFTITNKDGARVKFKFMKPKGSVWYWNVPLETRGEIGSLPLPDVELGKVNDLQNCLRLIAEKRGVNWVDRIVADIFRTTKEKQNDN